jgi:prepilin-type N-terminal cleavage/methylation domain-containing protein
MQRRKAFTLLELLVVIGIILLLVSILLPVLNSARTQGKAVVCQSHLRQLWQGFTMFAAAHDSHLPGCAADSTSTDPDHYDWLGGKFASTGGVTDDLMLPQSGTIFKYVGHQYDIYRCPALEVMDNGAAGGSGAGSNGRFDYVAFEFFSGTRLDRLPMTAQVQRGMPGAPFGATLPCPVIIEEDANQLNRGNKDPNHSNVDQMAHQHWGGCYYVATDGSVQFYIEPPGPTGDFAHYYYAQSIRGKWVGIGGGAQRWGWWESQ